MKTRETRSFFNMADKEGQFTEAEKKQLEMLNERFTLRQKYMAKIKRRNLAVFACLLASVGGICILHCSEERERSRIQTLINAESMKKRVIFSAKFLSLARRSQLSLWQLESVNENYCLIRYCFIIKILCLQAYLN